MRICVGARGRKVFVTRACAVAASADGENGSSLASFEEEEDGRRAMRDQEVRVGMAARSAAAAVVVVGGFRARQQKARLRMPMSIERMVVASVFFLSVEGGTRE